MSTNSAPSKADNGTEAAYRVGEVAERLGLTLRTLKYYEELGLVAPQRTAGGYRMYTQADVQRLERVRRMASLGLSLRTIQSILNQPLETDARGRQVLTTAGLHAMVSSLEQQLSVLDGRIKAAEKELRDARALRQELQNDLNYMQKRLSDKTEGQH